MFHELRVLWSNSDKSWGKPVQITQGPTIFHMFSSFSAITSVDLQISYLRPSPSYSANDSQSFRFGVKCFRLARRPENFFFTGTEPGLSSPSMKGQAELSDARSSDRPTTAVTQALLDHADELIRNDGRITTRQRATELSATRKCEQHYWCVGMFKSVCSLGSMRPNRLPQISRYEDDGKSFVKQIVSRDAVEWFCYPLCHAVKPLVQVCALKLLNHCRNI